VDGMPSAGIHTFIYVIICGWKRDFSDQQIFGKIRKKQKSIMYVYIDQSG
jgi:hypothetical protein